MFFADIKNRCVPLFAVLLMFAGCCRMTKSVDAINKDICLVFLMNCGWDTEDEPCEVSFTRIPDTFDDVWMAFNEIQTAQGFDLMPYRGRQITKKSYAVIGYPGIVTAETVFADVFLCDEKIIAADIRSVNADGFLHGVLIKPDGNDQNG